MRHCHAIFHSISFICKTIKFIAMEYEKIITQGLLWQPIMIMMYVKSYKLLLFIQNLKKITLWRFIYIYIYIYIYINFNVSLFFTSKQDVKIMLLFRIFSFFERMIWLAGNYRKCHLSLNVLNFECHTVIAQNI